jgi:gliding motility-associated-like protein
MKKTLRFFTLLLFACSLLIGSAQDARASHLLGGDMTYVSLGNNQYRVKFRLYRDCSGITPSAFNLQYKNGGCNAVAQTTPFVQQGAVEAGNPFCRAVSAGPCQGPTGLPNYDVYNYLATVTLTPGEWILSTSQNARPALANIQAGDLYVEATLDNRNQGTTAVENNSPQFDPQDIPIQYSCWKQRTTITFSSTEADGDSLVYSLAAPLQACGTPAPYNTYPAIPPSLVPITCTGGATGFFSYAGSPAGTYSATNPIRLGVDTLGTCPLRTGATRTFNFNRQSRTITFTPGIYSATAGAAGGANKYQIAVLITEYRRINGVRRIIGTVRREANIIVIDCGTNSTPNPVQANPVTTNSNTTTVNTVDTTRIDVYSCNYSRVELNFTDPDNLRTPSANQLLTVALPANINTDPRYLDSGDVGTFNLTGNGTTNPRGVFFFQPSPTTVGRTILLSFRIEDNACPIKGVQNRVVVIRVLKGSFARAATTVGAPGIGGQVPPSICEGGQLILQGNVLRPDSIRRIATNTTQAQVYTFQWTASVGGNGLPAVTNVPTITVNPTTTTRYLLRITPTLGFAQGLCGDTTSVLVRVVQPPVLTITPSAPEVCAGAQVVLTALATRPAGIGSDLNDTYTYRWTGPGVPANATGPTLTVNPTTTTTYTVVANGASPYGCTVTNTVQVAVVPPPVVTATPSVPQVCAGTQVLLTANAVRPAGIGNGLPDTYTYTWTGPGLPANATGRTLTVAPTTLGVNTYTVTATGLSQFNCSATSTVQVTVVPPPTIVVRTNNAFVCPNGVATLTALASRTDNFSDTYTYTWTGGNLPAGTTGASITVRPTANTTYTVTALGNTQTGCGVVGTVQVQTAPALAVDFDASEALDANGQVTSKPPVVFNFRNTTSIANQPPGSTFTYAWTYERIQDAVGNDVNSTITSFSNAAPGTTATLPLSEAGTYRIRLTGNANVAGASCAPFVKERLVFVPDIVVPNIITPNGDQQNDVFKISTSLTRSKLEIYNRWGRKVYEQSNYANNWGGDNQPAGVYYYLLTDSRGVQTKGWLEVVR